jgi:uncharacterized protein (TIGR02598 family)
LDYVIVMVVPQLKPRCTAFSLIEVSLSLAIVAFALLSMMALMPVGLKMMSDSSQAEVIANILTQLRGQLQQVPFTQNTSGQPGVDTSTIITLNGVNQKTYYDITGTQLPHGTVGPNFFYSATFLVPTAASPYTINQDSVGIGTNNALPVTVVITYPVYPTTLPASSQKSVTNVIFAAKQVGL